MNKNIKKIGKAVAGSALLVGATLTGAAGLASAAQGTQDLGDYPTPFVNDDGEVSSTVVVGESAKTVDVVGAVNIAGSLGNAAFGEEAISVPGATSGSWTAENGITLDRQNSPIFFPESTDAEESRLDDQDIPSLATTTVQSEDNEEVEIEHDVQVGTQAQKFDADAGDVDNPVLYIDVPTTPTVGDSADYLLQGAVEFDSTMDFTATETDNAHTDAEEVLEDGDTVEIFGQEYTYSDESESDELVLYGNSERFEVATGESTTVTVDGEESTFEASYVQDSGESATITVDGQTESVEEGDTVTVSGQDVRVSDVYRTGADGQGRVAFSIGSSELVITQDDVEVDGDSVDGVSVQVNDGAGNFSAVDSLTFAFGAEDSDEDYLEAGSTYETPVFGLEFHYGGLSGNVAEDPAETLELDAQEDDNAELTFTTDGEEATVSVAEFDGTDLDFGDDDGEIAEFEGEPVGEDEKVVLNSNGEADMYEVTDVDDTDLTDGDEDGTITVTLENVATGETVEVEEDADFNENGAPYTVLGESIEGKDFDVTFTGSSDEVSFERSSAGEDEVQVLPALYTQTDAAISFYEHDLSVSDTSGDSAAVVNLSKAVTTEDFSSTVEDGSYTTSSGDYLSLSSGQATAANVDAVVNYENGDTTTGSLDGDLTLDGSKTIDSVEVTADGTVTLKIFSSSDAEQKSYGEVAGTVQKTFEVPSGVASNDATFTATFDRIDQVASEPEALSSQLDDFVQADYELVNDGTAADNEYYLNVTTGDVGPNALFTQPENDNDEEHAYALNVDVQESSANINVADTYADTADNDERQTDTLDDEDVTVGYDQYGAYSERDHEDSDQQTFTLNMPSAQATSGMAVTGTDGSVSSEGGSAGSVTSSTPMGWPDAAALDSDSNIDSLKTSDELILVGGPSVNSLTAELAQDNKTWSASDYSEGDAIVQVVNDAFAEGQDAVVVAGYAGEDTREAANYLANYADHSEELAGQETVELTTQQTQNAE